jgi:hypothetical protein
MRGRVVRVVDGETIHVQVGKRREREHDIGVNAPEIPHAVRGWQHGGEPAASSLATSRRPATVRPGSWGRQSMCRHSLHEEIAWNLQQSQLREQPLLGATPLYDWAPLRGEFQDWTRWSNGTHD